MSEQVDRVEELTRKLKVAYQSIRDLVDDKVENYRLNHRGYCNHPGNKASCIEECNECTDKAMEKYRKTLLEEYLPDGAEDVEQESE